MLYLAFVHVNKQVRIVIKIMTSVNYLTKLYLVKALNVRKNVLEN